MLELLEPVRVETARRRLRSSLRALAIVPAALDAAAPAAGPARLAATALR